MSILIWCVLGVLALKVIWNFGVPYALMSKPIDPKTGKRGGISLSLSTELFLLILAVGLSWFSNGDSLINRPLAVLIYGGGAILLSYLHFFIGGMICNWFVARRDVSSRSDAPPSPPKA
ncbi:MAG: hypothetical protein EBT89_09885 [Opitutaceae bacterium]|jgi:hypothetical protein|nr:hypothetical protein [Opitutaceae bacterium]